MMNKVLANLNEYAKDKELKISRTKLNGFDFIAEDKVQKTYIKVIPNFSNYEVLVNGLYKWEIKKSPTDKKIYMLDSVEVPILSKIESEKKINKLFIIYPSSRLLMMAVNECEYMFIYPDIDVHGYRVINYNEFEFLINSKNFNL